DRPQGWVAARGRTPCARAGVCAVKRRGDTTMKLPISDQSVALPTAPQSGVSPTANPAAWAAPYASTAEGAQRATGELLDAAKSLQQGIRQEDITDTAKRLATAHLDATKLVMDEQQAAGEGAPDFTKTVLGKFDQYARDTLANAPEQTRTWLERSL